MAIHKADDRPAYVKCAPEAWALAKVRYAQLQVDPAFAMQARYRTAAVAAAMANGAHIDPLLALEFRTMIEAREYVPRQPTPLLVRVAGDILAARDWHEDAPVPNAPPPSDFAWLDEVAGPRFPGFRR